MEPMLFIVWIAVAVFALTSLIALLYLAGLLPSVDPEHGKHLYKIVIAEVAILSVSTFGYYMKMQIQPKEPYTIPVSNFMLVEQNPSVKFNDGSKKIYVRSDDVSRVRREIDIEVSNQENFSESQKLTLKSGVSKEVDISGAIYYLFFEQMGSIDKDPAKKNPNTKDFVLLSIISKPTRTGLTPSR